MASVIQDRIPRAGKRQNRKQASNIRTARASQTTDTYIDHLPTDLQTKPLLQPDPSNPDLYRALKLKIDSRQGLKSRRQYTSLYERAHTVPSFSRVRTNYGALIQGVVNTNLSSWQQSTTQGVDQTYYSRKLTDKEFNSSVGRAQKSVTGIAAKALADKSTNAITDRVDTPAKINPLTRAPANFTVDPQSKQIRATPSLYQQQQRQ